ncbi:DMT family transporter [Alkalibacter rhizosphaerae]|uniref:DMT family transporter n=1 Tax=Alkalibacter rhizosphaerae TaxID=2815577 RepID=UPI001FEE253A|nr:DMT family transporter [Alkalibacter rhizosphaerae]
MTAILAAVLYGISVPISKLLLEGIPPEWMAALLYLGAGFGMMLINGFRKRNGSERMEATLAKEDRPFIVGMIVLDVAAPILLMLGLTSTSSGSVALLNNFEVVATSLVALVIFKEHLDGRMWIALSLITGASFLLSIENIGEFTFSMGSIFVLLATICWGIENNCTRMLSLKDPLQVVMVKGLGSGMGALIIAIWVRSPIIYPWYMVPALLLGFVSYGLSIYFYIHAQRHLGAARTSAFYAAAPFVGVVVSWILFQESISTTFAMAMGLMLVGSYLVVSERHSHLHLHEEMRHDHRHSHEDFHSTHFHADSIDGEHSHTHVHEAVEHDHQHTPDMHHHHEHGNE